MKIGRHCIVSGKVQGVFYRQNTYEKANTLGLKGWVRNLDNGDVECLIMGEEEDVEALCQWLHQGPPAARVTGVKIEEAPWEEHAQFLIKR
jgi:acylphosphatase